MLGFTRGGKIKGNYNTTLHDVKEMKNNYVKITIKKKKKKVDSALHQPHM